MVDFPAFSQGGRNDKTVRVAVSLYLFWSNYNHIHSLPYPVKSHINAPYQTATVAFPLLHHQQIHITMWPHLPSGCRAKKKDLLRLGHLHHPADNLLKSLFIQPFFPGYHRNLPFMPGFAVCCAGGVSIVVVCNLDCHLFSKIHRFMPDPEPPSSVGFLSPTQPSPLGCGLCGWVRLSETLRFGSIYRIRLGVP